MTNYLQKPGFKRDAILVKQQNHNIRHNDFFIIKSLIKAARASN